MAAAPPPALVVRPSRVLGAGRGLFTTRAVRRGELLLSETALAVAPARPPPPVPACTHCAAPLGPVRAWVAAVCDALACPAPSNDVLAAFAHILELPDDTPACSSCDARYCSAACLAEDALHMYVCEGSAVSSTTSRCALRECVEQNVDGAKFLMAAELLARIAKARHVEEEHPTVEAAAVAMLGDFTCIPWTCYGLPDADSIRPAPFASLLDELSPKRHEIFKQELLRPHAALEELLGIPIPCAVLDAVLGVVVLNSRRLCRYSPLHALLDAVAPSLAFDVLPLRLALEDHAAALTTELSALCPLYAMLNHSCEHSVAGALSEDDELQRALTQPSGRTSRLFAVIDLDKDTEVFADYMSRELGPVERRTRLWRQYRIDCKCAACRR